MFCPTSETPDDDWDDMPEDLDLPNIADLESLSITSSNPRFSPMGDVGESSDQAKQVDPLLGYR